jgi:hypothetical protein
LWKGSILHILTKPFRYWHDDDDDDDDDDDLWKISAPVGHCEEFDLTHFDKTIQVLT